MSGVDPYTRLAAVYDEIVVDPCHGRWACFLHEVWGADTGGVRTVVDVCCGTGLMAAALTALDYRVAGVDASSSMLARARELLGPDAVLVRETLPDLTIDGVFDAAVSTFDGLNYLTPAQLRATLAALARRLRPRGWFVFDLHTDTMMAFAATSPVVAGEANGHSYTIESVVDVCARTCDTRIEVTRTGDGDTFTEHHRQYFFTDRHIRGALADAGFRVVAVTDEYTHEPVGASSLRATWITRRGAR